jgi:hypothetical protein
MLDRYTFVKLVCPHKVRNNLPVLVGTVPVRIGHLTHRNINNGQWSDDSMSLGDSERSVQYSTMASTPDSVYFIYSYLLSMVGNGDDSMSQSVSRQGQDSVLSPAGVHSYTRRRMITNTGFGKDLGPIPDLGRISDQC